MRTSAAALAVACALAGCASAGPYAHFDDPRPEGRMSLRERSLCEPPEGLNARADWCDFPHDVRAYVQRRDSCDHFRGEPWPEGDAPGMRERRAQLTSAMRAWCAGADRGLAELRERYRADARIAALLAGFETSIEP